MASQKFSTLPALRRQHLLAEFTGLKQACPDGVYVGLTPGDPSLWSGVIFVRDGPYAPAVMRFQISFPDSYPKLPPLVTFSTDMFHPLITPLSTYTYSTDVGDNGTVSATDEERLPPGGFSLRHGFPDWFGRRGRRTTDKKQAGGDQEARQTPHRPPPPSDLSSGGTVGSRNSAMGQSPGFFDTKVKEVSIFAVLHYIRSTFDDEEALDAIPLEAAGNPGAWQAWRTHRIGKGKEFESPSALSDTAAAISSEVSQGSTRKPGEWNWEGVWEERVQKGISTSLSESVMFGGAGAADDVVSALWPLLLPCDAMCEGLCGRLNHLPAYRYVF
ncbi:ubiquitin-conjugating enzyme/RWD-like protein [Nemania abortiva]|nr:ubiquitin-conjugating enzyme/RWD-like protein [Nemania abortiva]